MNEREQDIENGSIQIQSPTKEISMQNEQRSYYNQNDL